MNNKTFLDKVIKIHSDTLDFSKTKFNGDFNEKVIVTCPIHGDFELRAKHLLYSKQGCKECKKDNQRIKLNEVIKRIKEIHGDKYGLDKIHYKNNKTPIILTCPIHGDFEITLQSIFQQHAGCQKCGYISMKNKHLQGQKEKFLKNAKEIFNDDYDYSNIVYLGNKRKVKIKCNKCKHVFEVTPNNHLSNKSGCPKCNQSKLENEIEIFLKENNIKYETQHKFDWLEFKKLLKLDFYLPQYNIAIECQGIQHFIPIEHFGGEEQFIERQARDKIKKQLCEEHEIKLLYYSSLKEYDEFLGEKIYHCIDELSKIINP